MKKRKFKVLLSLVLGAAVMFAGCASGGDDNSVKLQEIPGTIGKVNSELLAASELAKKIDPNDEKVILFYNRADGNYSDWALWLWEDGGEGELAFSSTIGQFKSKDVLPDLFKLEKILVCIDTNFSCLLLSISASSNFDAFK